MRPSFNPLKKALEEAAKKSPQLEKEIESVREKKAEKIIEEAKRVESIPGLLVCLEKAVKEGFIRKARPDEVKEIEGKLTELKKRAEKAEKSDQKEKEIKLLKAYYSLKRRTLEIKNRNKTFFYVEEDFVKPSYVKKREKIGKQINLEVLRALAKREKEILGRKKKKEENK